VTYKVVCPYCGNKVTVFPDQKSGDIKAGVMCGVENGGCDSWFFVFGEVKLVYEARKIEGEGNTGGKA
jgi:hypothetical protein